MTSIPKTFKTMDPAKREAMLEGQVDILTAEAANRADFLSHMQCPNCAMTPCIPSVNPRQPFGGELLAKTHLKCPNCDLEFDPYTGIQHNVAGVPKDGARVTRAVFGLDNVKK